MSIKVTGRHIEYKNYDILNYLQLSLDVIQSSFCACKVLSADGQNQVGKISKQWSGLAKEMFTDADNFGITCKYPQIRFS